MNAEFHENLKEARLSKGLSQKEVAEKIGVAKSTYSLYESGNREPGVPIIKKIISVLGVSGDDLIGLNDNNKDANVYSEQEIVHINKYRSIDNKGRHTVDTVLDMEYNRCTKSQQEQSTLPQNKKYIPTEEDIRSLVARNGKKLSREEAIEFISTMYDEDDED